MRVAGEMGATRKNRHNYYPFGMLMPGRQSNAGEYRWGFNAQEKDDEFRGSGNSLNYKYRMYDSRVARFFSIDPIASDFPMLTPYQHSSLIQFG